MGRARGRKTRDKNKSSLPQVPENMKRANKDAEFSDELTNQTEREAMARALALNPLTKKRKKKR